MSLSTVHHAIQNFFTTSWAASYNTPIAYQNVDYDSEGVDEWVQLYILWDDQEQASRGADCQYHRFYGTILIKVFTPVNQGMQRNLLLAGSIIDIMSSRQIGGATLETAGPIMVGQVNNWHQTNVTCDFYYDWQLSAR